MKPSGAVAVVTGGASGIGRGVVELLVARGGRAVIADLESSAGGEVAQQLGPNVRFVPCDVTQPAMVEAVVAAALDAFGRIDLLVSCAGVSIGARIVGRDGVLHSLDLFRKHIDINLVGMFDMIRNVAGAMAKNEPGDDGERGLIVNIASIAGYEGQVGQAAYGSSKGGVLAMTLPLARDLGQLGIRVMCICPGTMDTPLLAGLSRDFIDRLAENNVFPKRVGVPADVASLVAQLMENTYFNGEVIRLDAGLRLAPR
ncbi:MAG: SDR family NAD(P)-dependent oxidoreductase [Acidimicrobiales bacterium]